MKILHQLDRPDFRASKSDKLLLRFIRESAPEFCTTPIASLAEKCGVSEATITRFVRKMGFGSLQLFKLTLAEELADAKKRSVLSSGIACDEEVAVTAGKLLANDIAALEYTVSRLDSSAVAESARLMLEAQEVFFVGLGSSGPAAYDSADKFMDLGIRAQGLGSSRAIMRNLAMAGEGSVIVCISHSGEAREMEQAAALAGQNGAKLIAVTANRDSAMAQWADVCVFYEDGQAVLGSGTVPSKPAQSFVIDLIYAQAAKCSGRAPSLPCRNADEALVDMPVEETLF